MKGTLLSLAGFLLCAGALVASFPDDQGFPHETHEGLFPLCVGCHVGAETGVEAEFYPEAATCAACHDGIREARVEWSPPGPRVSNLEFSHPLHRDLVEAAGAPATCESCHVADDGPGRMSVIEATAEGCLSCHAHEAEAHLAQGRDCTACHIPLARADRLSVERIAGFPVPESHDSPGFVSAHGPETGWEQASCATCHARETCVRCHVNAGTVEAIMGLESDERVAALEEGRPAEYPVPETHAAPGWSWSHGPAAYAGAATCANCHTRPSCTGCHIGAEGVAANVLATLPDPVPGGAPGVDLSGLEARVHPAGFSERHSVFASSGALDCVGCHTRESCVACHASGFSDASLPRDVVPPPSVASTATPAGATSSRPVPGAIMLHVSVTDPRGGRRADGGAEAGFPGDTVARPPAPSLPGGAGGYHPANFMERHAAEVFMARTDCQSCHSTEAFCRDCHAELGLASSGRLNTAFHTAQPLWLLAHGEAARLGLESCAACHSQTDCLACHSAVQGRGVNPHGPGFNADRMAARNRITCQWCHLSDP